MKNVSLGIFDPSLGIFDPARSRRNRDFLGGFPPKPRSVLRNRQGIPRLSGVSSRAHEGETHRARAQDTFNVGTLKGVGRVYQQTVIDHERGR